jgi:hypothetical protein
MAAFLKRVATKPIPADLLGAAAQAIADLPEGDRRDLTGRIIAVIRILDEQNVPRDLKDRSDLLMGIQFRLEALARLRDEPSYRAWSMKSGTPHLHYVHGDLVEVAATEPLIIRKRVARFEPKSFFKRVLQVSEARGRA